MAIRRLLAIGVTTAAVAGAAASPAAAEHVDGSQTRPVQVIASDVTLCALGECTTVPGGDVYAGDLILTLSGHSNGYTVTDLGESTGTCPDGYQAIGWEITTGGGWLDVGLVFDPVVGDPVGLAAQRIQGGPQARGFALCFK